MLHLLYALWRLIRTHDTGTVTTAPDSLRVTVGGIGNTEGSLDAELQYDHYDVILTVDGQSNVLGPVERIAARLLIATENRAERRERAKGYRLAVKGLRTQPRA